MHLCTHMSSLKKQIVLLVENGDKLPNSLIRHAFDSFSQKKKGMHLIHFGKCLGDRMRLLLCPKQRNWIWLVPPNIFYQKKRIQHAVSAKVIGHLGHHLMPPLIRGSPNSNNILYNIEFSYGKKKKKGKRKRKITNGHHQIPSGHEGPFLTEKKAEVTMWHEG